MTSSNSKKPLSRHLSIGPKPPAQPSKTSAATDSSPAAIKNADKDQSTFLRRRQTENNIDSLQEKLGECSFSHPPPPSSLPAKKEGSSGSADADEDEKKKTNEEANKPRLFAMEKWLYYEGEEMAGDGKEMEVMREEPTSVVIEHRRPVDATPIYAGHRDVIRRTWPIIADQMNANGCQIFLCIFELSPGIKRVFGFGPAMSGAQIVNHPRLVQHASRFMEAMQVAVQHLDELDTVVSPIFINLGKRHIYFEGINADYFNVFSGAILYTWRQVLGERFSAEVRSAWSRLFDFVIQHLRFGYELELNDNRSRSEGHEKTDHNLH